MPNKFSHIAHCFVAGVKDFQWSKELESLIKEFPVSGLALFNSPFESPLNIWKNPEAAMEAVYGFIQKSIEFKIPFVAVDQEGGRVRRLRGPFVALPSAEALAKAHFDKALPILKMRKLFEIAAEQMRVTEIGVNFAPVCDLRYKESNKVIGDRSFGTSLKEALPFVEAFLGAFHDKGVATTLKHFPGHGPSKEDSHEEIAVLFKTKDEILKEDLQVFKRAAERAKAVMTAHIAFEDEPERLFSLDRELLSEFRDQLPKHLAWFTDDILSMKAVEGRKPWLSAFDADYDFILLCGELGATYAALEETLKYVEKETRTFGQEQVLEKKTKRSHQFFLRPASQGHERKLPSFSQWKEKILSLQKEGDAILADMPKENLKNVERA